MSDLTINGFNAARQLPAFKPESKDGAGGFGEVMQEALGKLSEIQEAADNAVKGVASGGDITEAMIAMEKADISFQLMVEVRNRLLSAYEEISRMQV